MIKTQWNERSRVMNTPCLTIMTSQHGKVAALVLFFLAGCSNRTLLAADAQPPAPAPNLTADQIVEKSQRAFYYAGQDMSARVEMKLISAGGQERLRDLAMLRRNGEAGLPTENLAKAGLPTEVPNAKRLGTKAGRQKYFMYFHSPADVRGMAFLVWKEPGRDADRWMFIPALNLVQRVAARDAESSFVGSDFSYEDVSGRPLDADTRTLLREDDLDGKPCYVVESIPRSRAGFTRKLAWIDKTIFLPLKEEYYDEQKQLFKVFTADEVREVNGLPTTVKRTMKNIKSDHRTEVVFRLIKYNLSLPEDLFTERSLRRPPAQWISNQ